MSGCEPKNIRRRVMADDIEIVLASDSITQINVGAQLKPLAAPGFASIGHSSQRPLRGDNFGTPNGRFGRTWKAQSFTPVTDGPSVRLQANCR